MHEVHIERLVSFWKYQIYVKGYIKIRIHPNSSKRSKTPEKTFNLAVQAKFPKKLQKTKCPLRPDS